MAAVLTAILTLKLPLKSSLKRSLPNRNMNVVSLVAVFSLGIACTVLVSFLSEHFRNELLRQESERLVAEAIASRREIFEKSRSLTSIPDESQLTVVDAELVSKSAVQKNPERKQNPNGGNLVILAPLPVP